MRHQATKCLSVLVTCLCATTMAVAQQVFAPRLQPGTIIGTVKHVNNAVIPGATVVLRASSPCDERHLVSEDSGRFKFHNVPASEAVTRRGQCHRFCRLDIKRLDTQTQPVLYCFRNRVARLYCPSHHKCYSSLPLHR